MGLDMFLYQQYGLNPEFHHENEVAFKHNKKVITFGKNELAYITKEVLYWRKSNAIHKWFVDNVQDGIDNCATYYVGRETLQELLRTVKEVINNHALADIYLPTTHDFFFGNTSYDEYYFKDLETTRDGLVKILKDKNAYDFQYHSSW